MTIELKQFLKKIETIGQSFLFAKLYSNPSSVLGSTKNGEEIEKECLNLPDYYNLMLNNNLLTFLNICLKDDFFLDKLDFSLLVKLRYFLWDSCEFKKHYDLYNEDFIMLCKNKISWEEYLERTGFYSITLMALANIWKKYKQLFEYGYSKEYVDNYNNDLAQSIKGKIESEINFVMDERTSDKESVLKRVAKDDYSGEPDDVYLYAMCGIGDEVIDALVCENKFLEVVKELYEEGKLSGVILRNVISILTFGINIKNYTMQDALYYRERLGSELVNSFNLTKAQELQSMLVLHRKRKEKTSRLELVR